MTRREQQRIQAEMSVKSHFIRKGSVFARFTGNNTDSLPHVESPPRRPTELTPIGEQYVIPGCERHTTPKIKQLSLWDAT
jgi:hypothetical protein